MVNIDASVKRIAELETQIAKATEELREHKQTVTGFLVGSGASRYVTEDFEAVLKLGSPHFDFDGLKGKLGEHLGKEDFQDMFPPSRTCRMCKGSGEEPAVINGTIARRIASYAPRNGIDFARIIDEHTTRDAPGLMVKRKA